MSEPPTSLQNNQMNRRLVSLHYILYQEYFMTNIQLTNYSADNHLLFICL